MNVYASPTGKPDSIEFRDFNRTSDILNDLVFLNTNRGYGFDLGFQYLINDKLTLSGSILDLGYINWKSNVNTLSGGGDYTLEGIDLNQPDSVNFIETLLDTLQDVYDVTVTNDPYSQLLTPKLYIGASYSPYKFIKLGFLSRSEYIAKTFRQQITGSATIYMSQFFGTTLSYTIADKMYDNLGLAFVFRTGPLQIYLMSDRIPLFWYSVKGDNIPYLPIYARNANFRMGLNLVFGANQKRKLMKDQPFLD
ncbi:MAG: hypothetical protein HC905_00075 [Bacteroidales bacterium]|nr:hypothetical protein [Bacteroidales bacterium]